MEKRRDISQRKEGLSNVQKEPVYGLQCKVQSTIATCAGRGHQKTQEKELLAMTTTTSHVSILSLDTLPKIQESCGSFVNFNSEERRSKGSFELQQFYPPDGGESSPTLLEQAKDTMPPPIQTYLKDSTRDTLSIISTKGDGKSMSNHYHNSTQYTIIEAMELGLKVHTN